MALVMASVVWKNVVKSFVSHTANGVLGFPNRILPIAHVSLVVTVSIVSVSSHRRYHLSVGVAGRPLAALE